MQQEFFQFNNSIITEITDFAISSLDILFISGPKGSAKRETVQKVIPELEEKNLIFEHFCFENSVIDDFLLNFYDALRNFSLAQKISLKKFATDNFQQKVSHYFKTLGCSCIIVIENFEKVQQNVEIVDFLSHLANYENVKIIIISEKTNTNLFRFKPVKMKTLEVSEISKDEFKSKIETLLESCDDNLKEKFYNIAYGLELYLQMGIKYCNVTNINLEDLLNEFERKEIDFEEFLVSKFISLIPNNYQQLFKMLCIIGHPVSQNFLIEYNLGNENQISYISKNFLISFFKDEIYIKDYFKKYIIKNFSVQEKINYGKNLIDIYENELTKSPATRLLRLSRESIRKEIEVLNASIPQLNNTKKSTPFSYLGLNSLQSDNLSKQKSKLAEKFEKIKQRKKALSFTKEDKSLLVSKRLKDNNNSSLIDESKKKDRLFIIELINNARDLTSNYKYVESNNELQRAINLDYNDEFKIEILMMCAKNNQALNNFSNALENYNEALKYANQTFDNRKFELEFLIATINKNLYKTETAKKQFLELFNNNNLYNKYKAQSALELGEIEESENKLSSAIKYYNDAIEESIGKNKKLLCTSYYKLAVLYDENGEWEKAIEFYEKNYLTSSYKDTNKYYSISLTNLALIYIEQSKYIKASKFLKLALEFDTENNDLENIYFSQKELAKLYTYIDAKSAVGYYKEALETAKKLKDDFKIALAYFEFGEFYYDSEDDKNALMNFIEAKKYIKDGDNDENINRINSRIKDIKMRLDNLTFNLIIEKYDK